MTGTYGTLFFGNWDTPYKYPTLFVGPVRSLNPFDNTLTGNTLKSKHLRQRIFIQSTTYRDIRG